MKIFSGNANIPLAQNIAKRLLTGLSSLETHVFPDGERRVRIASGVVGEDTIVIQSANTPVDSNYMELFFILDGLKRSGAHSITAVVPYFGYQRQDHVFRDGEAVSLEVIIQFLESLKIDKFISFDLHSPRIPDLFRIPVTHLSALPLFAEYMKKKQWDTSETILVSPDVGGIPRVERMAQLVGVPFVVLEKNRDLVSGEVNGGKIVQGRIESKKRAVVIDDMISSGKTLVLAAESLANFGVEEIYVFATHALFSKEASQVLQLSKITKIFVTDTVLVPDEKKFEKLEIISVADSIAAALER